MSGKLAFDKQNMTGAAGREDDPPIARIRGVLTTVGGAQADKGILSGNDDSISIYGGGCHGGLRPDSFGGIQYNVPPCCKMQRATSFRPTSIHGAQTRGAVRPNESRLNSSE